jgi:hypothetical protein
MEKLYSIFNTRIHNYKKKRHDIEPIMKSVLFKTGFLFLLIVAIGAGCKKENSSSTACGVESPLTNLHWLMDLKVNLEEDTIVNSAEIILYRLDNVDYIYVQKNIFSLYDLPNTIFDCEGNELYKCGGNQPVDNCSTFFSEARQIDVIWEKE